MEGNLSVILIAHNEEDNIGRMIEGMLKNYDREILEIVVVDDVSMDKTALIAEEFMERSGKVRLIRRSFPCGVGRALKTGFKNVSPKADYVLTMDSDFLQNIEQVHHMIDGIEKGYDGVMGSRFIGGSKLVNYPLPKKIMNRAFHVIVKKLFNIKQMDLTNNFKLYKKEIFQSLPWKSDGFAINAETGILPIIASYNIGEVPVSWVERESDMGKSKFRMFRHGWSYIKVILLAWKLLRSGAGKGK